MAQFIETVPPARPVYEQHVRDGEILPHVLMADLRRMFVKLVEAGKDDDVKQFLEAIETLAASPADSIRNVVDISFIEDLVLGDSGEVHALNAVRERLGPATAAQLAATEWFHENSPPGDS